MFKKDAFPSLIQLDVDSAIKSTITDMSTLMSLNSKNLGPGLGDSIGYVIVADKVHLASTTRSLFSIKISNTKFVKTYSANISAISSISSPELVEIANPILVNTKQEIQLKFGSLGEPSCALISYQLNSLVYYIGKIGTDVTTCSNYYKNVNFIENYRTSGNVWKFDVFLNKIGLVQLNVAISNQLESVSLASINLNVMSAPLDCQNPTVAIDKTSAYFYEPTVYSRNELFSLKGRATIKCNISLENSKHWSVFRVDPSTGKDQTSLGLNDNPTVDYGELVVQPSVLDYGLYRFNFKVTMLNTKNALFESEQDSFVSIVPSGIYLSSLAASKIPDGGTYEMTKGTQQDIQFNPFIYSYDVDSMVDIATLNFKYYCQVIEFGVETGYPKLSLSQNVDLSLYKTRSDLAMSENLTCFDSAGRKKVLFRQS